MAAEMIKAYRIPRQGAAAEWQEIPLPAPDSGQVLIKMDAAGICRTDLEIMDHGVQFRPWVGPYTLGHENVGTVEKAGDGVHGLAVGTKVVVNSGMTCGVCRNCRTGNDNYCTNKLGTYGTLNDGGLAPYMVARERDVLSIGALDPVTAAPLGDAGATAYGAVNRALQVVGDNGFVVVIGVGGVGAFVLQLLRLKSAATVIAVDLPNRLDYAIQRGAHVTVPSDERAAAAILELTGGAGADAVIDNVGIDATLTLAAEVTRSLGDVLLLGTGGGSVPFRFAASKAGVRYSTHLTCTMAELAELVGIAERGLLTVDAMPYTFDRLEEAYDDLRAGRITGRGVITF